MKLIVLMQNDYPIGIYSTPELAQKAAEKHYMAHYERPYPNLDISNFHYRQYSFEVDDDR